MFYLINCQQKDKSFFSLDNLNNTLFISICQEISVDKNRLLRQQEPASSIPKNDTLIRKNIVSSSEQSSYMYIFLDYEHIIIYNKLMKKRVFFNIAYRALKEDITYYIM